MVTAGPVGGPQTLDELTRVTGPRPAWLMSLVQPEIGGGKMQPAQFAELDTAEDVTALRVSGLDQAAFEQLIADHGHRFTAIHFWKCPRVADLSPLGDLHRLQFVAWYWNQRASTVWDLSRTPHLRGLALEDFTKLEVLDDFRAGTSLDELVLGDVVDRRSVFASLDPLGELTGLRRLQFTPRAIGDGRVDAVGRLVGLEDLNCPTNLFTTRQFAWLRARLPAAARSRVLQPYLSLDPPLGGKDVLLIGRRQPFLDSTVSAARIQRHVDRFDADVAAFSADPHRRPD